MGRPRVVKTLSKNIDFGRGKLGKEAVTDYDANYISYRNFERVKPIFPKPDTPMKRSPPMQGETTTMKSFKNINVSEKRELIKPEENQQLSTEPLQKESAYMKDFTRKTPLPVVIARPLTHSEERRGNLTKFDDRTLNKHFYKEWQPSRPQRYGELPSFTQSLIYPDECEAFESRTKTDFPYKTMKKPEMTKAAAPNIVVGMGDQDHETTHRNTYKYRRTEPAFAVKPSTAKKFSKLPKMEGKTNYQMNFPKPKGFEPVMQSKPAPDTLEIKMNDLHIFDTEQRNQYGGWDVLKHKRPDAAKLSDNTEFSTEKMVTETTMTKDFVPVDIMKLERQVIDRPRTNAQAPINIKFQDATTNKTQFPDWGVGRRKRYGDFNEAIRKLKLHNQLMMKQNPVLSTTKSTFLGEFGRPRTMMKPPNKTIDRSQPYDFNTVGRMTYRHPPASAYEIEDFEIKC